MARTAGSPEDEDASRPVGLMERIAEAQGVEVTAEDWKKRGGEAYARKEWREAAECYSQALQRCAPGSDLAVTCLNNRAACHSQEKEFLLVIRDTSEVIKQQPANTKALLRRMVALDSLGNRDEEALKDASAVLTLEPKNAHALQVVAKRRKNLTKKATDALPSAPRGQPEVSIAVFLFSEDRPLQCYACLRSLRKHLRGAVLQVSVFWQAGERPCFHSYQLLQGLPEVNSLQYGEVAWHEVSKGQLFSAFSRAVNRLSVEGVRHLLLLSDTSVFHSDADVGAASAVLSERSETFAVRLDLNPRIAYFPEANLYASSPHLKPFANDPRLLVWIRRFDTSKMAYEAVPRESGWDEILNWTASIVRAERVQHFFSALQGQKFESVRELDDKAADWLSRRQRMKRSEVSHRSACFASPVMVTLDPASFGTAQEADALLRAHLHRSWSSGSSAAAGKDGLAELAKKLSWSPREVSDYFQGVVTKGTGPSLGILQGLLEPERYEEHYFDAVGVPLAIPCTGLPRALANGPPLVSWLVPARNTEDFVLDCMNSIEAQAGIGPGTFEIVVVEDASEDGTLAVLHRFAEGRPHVRVIESDGMQRGIAGSLQEGWLHCRGDFVARLDADDEAEPQRLAMQLRYLERHPCISVLGGRHRPFFSEQRKFTVEKVAKKEDGRLCAAVWREFHGQQTSRKREQLIIAQKGEEILVVDGPAEYVNCKLLRVGEESMALHPERWQQALTSVQGGHGEVLMLRRDDVEPPRGSSWLHPCLVRAASIFEDCIVGTTATLRRGHFSKECPYPREEAENHWCTLNLESHQHAANLADPLVRTRRHEANRAVRDEADILESKCAAVQCHLTKAHAADVDLQDAAALLNFRGPRTPEQGEKLLDVLEQVERSLFAEFIRPQSPESRGDFWEDFVCGREVALERAIVAMRMRFKALHDEVSQVITSVPEHSPRQHRSRTPPR
eukprot:TRINITY_DN48395_c0_g1_i1.p1 TRINITY_DN48395_c0_g1~~TRINITY_DN48395_c0_g1_i1.p1  ORF type:complete len:960 (+),score=205.69 TRINITY_DN48395_c0_g1_i1:23-2902(+)